MFSIALWLDSIKAKAGISSDYGLAKLLNKRQTTLSNYRSGRSLPDAEIIMQLCELSGDDPAVIMAQIQAVRAQDGKARSLWESMAARLQRGGAITAQIAVAATLSIALYPAESRASTLSVVQVSPNQHIMLSHKRKLATDSAMFCFLTRFLSIFAVKAPFQLAY